MQIKAIYHRFIPSVAPFSLLRLSPSPSLSQIAAAITNKSDNTTEGRQSLFSLSGQFTLYRLAVKTEV